MSQTAAVCRNKVHVELKAEIESLSRQRVLCHDIADEEWIKDYRDTLNSVTIIIKAKWQRKFVSTILPLLQHKRMKISI